LEKVRNVPCGLEARTIILMLLDNHCFAASRISKETTLSYNVVMHHLKLLKAESIVERKGSRRYFWIVTGFGQRQLF
jgi:predicted transcriptional regulator